MAECLLFFLSPLDDDSCLQATPCCLVTWREGKTERSPLWPRKPSLWPIENTAWVNSARFACNGQGCKDSGIKRKEKHDGRARSRGAGTATVVLLVLETMSNIKNKNDMNGSMTGVFYL